MRFSLGQARKTQTATGCFRPTVRVASKHQVKDPTFGVFYLVPEEGLEPSIPEERDFESRAYTNSATPAVHLFA